MVYRVYTDGRPDELVRGVDIVGTPLLSLTKIILTGDKEHVFNGVCGAESGSVPVSAVAPAMLFSEIEVQKRRRGANGRRFCRRLDLVTRRSPRPVPQPLQRRQHLRLPPISRQVRNHEVAGALVKQAHARAVRKRVGGCSADLNDGTEYLAVERPIVQCPTAQACRLRPPQCWPIRF